MTLNELIVSLCGLPTVSGSERRSTEALRGLIGAAFDEMQVDALGNHLFIKRCGRQDAPKILIDTHLDEIGMMVNGYRDGGFLTVANVGGVDTRILPAGEVVIYGKETLYGVVAAEPAHLLPGTVYLGFDCPQRQRELRGDLFVGVLLEETHQDQLPVAGCQPVEVLLDLRPLLEVDDALLGGRGARGRGIEAVVDRQVVLTTAHEVDERVARNGVDPLPERIVGTVTVNVDIDLDEGLLQQVVGVVRTAQPLYEQAVDGVAVTVEEVFESGIVPLEHPVDQLPVIGYDIVGYLHTRSSRRSSMTHSTAAHSGLSRS